MRHKDSNKTGCNVYMFFMTKCFVARGAITTHFAQQAVRCCGSSTPAEPSTLAQGWEAARDSVRLGSGWKCCGVEEEMQYMHYMKSQRSSRGGIVSQISSWHVSVLPLPSHFGTRGLLAFGLITFSIAELAAKSWVRSRPVLAAHHTLIGKADKSMT